MNLLVDRMERTDRSGLTPFLTPLSSKPTKLYAKSRMDKLAVPKSMLENPEELSLKSPSIVINDIPLVQAIEEIKHDISMVNLRDFFGNNENAVESASDREEEPSKVEATKVQQHYDFSCSSSGKFSDLEFNFDVSTRSRSLAVTSTSTNAIPSKKEPMSGKNSVSTLNDLSSSTSSLAFHRNSVFVSPFPNSLAQQKNKPRSLSNTLCCGVDKKRLVNQFLKPSEMTKLNNNNPNSADNLRLPFHSRNNSNEVSPSRSSSSVSLHSPMRRELESSSFLNSFSSVNTNSMTLMSDNESTNSSIYSTNFQIPGFKEIIKTASPSPSQFRPVLFGPKIDGEPKLKSKSRQKKKDLIRKEEDALNTPQYFQTHIEKTLKCFQQKVAYTFQHGIIDEEVKFNEMLENFDSLNSEYKRINGDIKNIRDLVRENYLAEIKQKFNCDDDSCFQSKLKLTVNGCVEGLETLEERMKICQNKLSAQKETIKRLDDLIVVENSLLELDKKTKPMYKYRYFIFDIFIFIFVIHFARSSHFVRGIYQHIL